jgi:hypothetical protein
MRNPAWQEPFFRLERPDAAPTVDSKWKSDRSAADAVASGMLTVEQSGNFGQF